MNFYTHVHIKKNMIHLRGYMNGRRVHETIDYQPYLFEYTGRPSEYKNLQGKPVEKITFSSINEAKDYLNTFKETKGKTIYGLNLFQYVFMNDEYPGEVEYDPNHISVVSLDIETDSSGGFPNVREADKAIIAITLSKNGRKVVLGLKPYKAKDDSTRYFMCRDERDLLNKFLTIWMSEEWSPDVVTGWNVEMFDIPYIVNRIRRILGEKDVRLLSPWRMVHEREIVRGKSSSNASKDLDQRIEVVYDMVGISVLDYLQLYKKFSFSNQASYKLDHIASVVLGERKIDYSEYGSLNDLYEKNFELFIDYNIHDVVLVDKLEEKLGLIKQVFAMAYDAKVNFIDVMTTVRPWDVIIHNYLMSKKIVIPQFDAGDNDFNLVGGHVKEPQIGMHEWVVSFDLNSLYPHLIMQYNISPETFIERTPDYASIDRLLQGEIEQPYSDRAYAANGCAYRKDRQGFLPELMQKMYDDRAKYKRMMIDAKKRYEETHSRADENAIARYHNLQLAKKIQLNSAYGALGNPYFRWFNFDYAESITMSGQLSIRWIEKKMNEYLNKLLGMDNFDFVIASDTDSIYVNLAPLVKKVYGDETDKAKIVDGLDKFIEAKIQPYIDKVYAELAFMMNAYEQKMKMKRESIADKGIWIAKKMYMLNVWDNEGVRYSEPKLKTMGIASVRSSTPAACREALTTGISKIMNENEDSIIRYIAEFREKFSTLPFEEIAFPRGIKNMARYYDSATIYKKSTPIQVKGALIYNKFTKKFGKKYMPITDGDKVRFAYLKLPNPVHDHVIAVPDDLPDEFNLDQFIDRETQFDKGFLEPMKSILDVINWDTEKRSTIEDFFS